MFSLYRIDECLFETTSPDLGVAQSQPSTYNAQTNVSNQLIMDMQKLAGPQRKEFEREIDKLRQEQVDKNSRSDISNSGGKSWTAVEVPATDKAMPHSLVADDEHIMAGPFHLPGLPGGRPLDDDDDLDDDGCGRKTKKNKDTKKTSRGKSRRRCRRDLSSSPASCSSSFTPTSGSEESSVRSGKHWSSLDHPGQRPKTQTLFFKFPQPEHYRNRRVRNCCFF